MFSICWFSNWQNLCLSLCNKTAVPAWPVPYIRPLAKTFGPQPKKKKSQCDIVNWSKNFKNEFLLNIVVSSAWEIVIVLLSERKS